jgi:ADP-heptose:LPS heptosyltransferase
VSEIDVLDLQRTTRRIAVFRALQLGDLMQAVPALRALREGFPGAEITLIGLPWASSFARRFQRYIDRFVEFAGYPHINELEYIPERTNRFMREQRAYGYDLAIQMHGSGPASNRFVGSLGARVTAGYFTCGEREELAIAAPYPYDQPEVYRNLGLARLLGCTQLNSRLEFPLDLSDHAEAAELLRAFPAAKRPWIGLHAGARPPSRRWPIAYFATVGDELARRFNAQIILTGSPDERSIARSLEDLMSARPVNLAGKTSLGGLAALLEMLDLFVSNDTGPAHIAYALDTPSITIFGPADYRRWAPLHRQRHRVVRHPVACSPCPYWECPIDHGCLRGVLPERVIEVAGELLERGVAA